MEGPTIKFGWPFPKALRSTYCSQRLFHNILDNLDRLIITYYIVYSHRLSYKLDNPNHHIIRTKLLGQCPFHLINAYSEFR